ncbi:MAG: hypothetical protein MUC41_13310 [Syntrophobacteraceae bacterium]|jgi:hypothetical protein|nr:hypothetical protein [Syntrophobacteraceae bacterium]
MIIGDDILARTCKDMIETILLTLEDATKGTIYRVGPMPVLQAVRVTSGYRDPSSGQIQWGLPEVSDYNFPGKSWEQYRDRPGSVLEAMGWCVERQKSWTADDPYEDLRSVRKQLSGEIEDFHHMEPVLVRKSDLYGEDLTGLEYPLDHQGKPIWQNNEYVVAAVIKIHFKPFRIKIGDRSTKIIKKLSRTLGTELISLHIRGTLADAQKNLTRQRLRSCNVLAHELRNTLIKLGFTTSAINTEIGYLREQWEAQVAQAFPHLETRRAILTRLNELLQSHLPLLNGNKHLKGLSQNLMASQAEMATLSLMPHVAERWLHHKILPKWKELLADTPLWQSSEEEILDLLNRLQDAIWTGTAEELAARMGHIPEDLREAWRRLAYTDFTLEKAPMLDEIIGLLDHPELRIPHQLQTKKILISLKVLAEMIPDVEERANRIICSLKNGDTTEDI